MQFRHLPEHQIRRRSNNPSASFRLSQKRILNSGHEIGTGHKHHLPTIPVGIPIVGRIIGKPVPVRTAIAEQPLKKFRERQGDDATVTRNTVAIPETVIAPTNALRTAAVDGNRLLSSCTRNDVPEIRDVVGALRSNNLWVRAGKGFRPNDPNWIGAVREETDSSRTPVELSQVIGKTVALTKNRLPTWGQHRATMRPINLVQELLNISHGPTP